MNSKKECRRFFIHHKLTEEFVSASRRNQHASGVCSPEFPLGQRTLQQNELYDL